MKSRTKSPSPGRSEETAGPFAEAQTRQSPTDRRQLTIDRRQLTINRRQPTYGRAERPVVEARRKKKVPNTFPRAKEEKSQNEKAAPPGGFCFSPPPRNVGAYSRPPQVSLFTRIAQKNTRTPKNETPAAAAEHRPPRTPSSAPPRLRGGERPKEKPLKKQRESPNPGPQRTTPRFCALHRLPTKANRKKTPRPSSKARKSSRRSPSRTKSGNPRGAQRTVAGSSPTAETKSERRSPSPTVQVCKHTLHSPAVC